MVDWLLRITVNEFRIHYFVKDFQLGSLLVSIKEGCRMREYRSF